MSLYNKIKIKILSYLFRLVRDTSPCTSTHTHTHTHTYIYIYIYIYKDTFCLYDFIKILWNFFSLSLFIYIYIYIYMSVFVCVCVCVCVWLGSSLSFKHVWLSNIATLSLYNFKILSSFLISVLVSGWNWRMNLPKLSWMLSDLSLAIHPPIPTWNQDTYQETWKDLNKII